MSHPAPVRPAAPHPAEEAPDPGDNSPEAALPPEAVRAVAGLLGEGRVVAHRPCFARAFGGAACGLLLSQFWFWSGTPTVRGRAGGWFWKSQREITEETGLTRAETETARRRLRALGVLEEERRGIPATLHFRLDTAAMQRLLWAHVQAQPAPAPPVQAQSPPLGAAPTPAPLPAPTAQTGLPIMRTFVRGSVANKFAGIAQTTSERTSEMISKKTQTGAQPVSPAASGERKTGTAVPGTAVPGTAVIGSSQCAVNRSGAARLKAALEAARKLGARPGGGRSPPAMEEAGWEEAGWEEAPALKVPVYPE